MRAEYTNLPQLAQCRSTSIAMHRPLAVAMCHDPREEFFSIFYPLTGDTAAKTRVPQGSLDALFALPLTPGEKLQRQKNNMMMM